MITFHQIEEAYEVGLASLSRQSIIAVLNELERKPYIKIDRETVVDRDMSQTWPQCEAEVIPQLLYYQNVPLSFKLWPNGAGVTLCFPGLTEKQFKMYKWGPVEKKTAELTWRFRSYNTIVECGGNTDELYTKIEQGYKRYQSKKKNIEVYNKKQMDARASDIKDLKKEGWKILE